MDNKFFWKVTLVNLNLIHLHISYKGLEYEGHIQTFTNVNICLLVGSNINTYVYAGIVIWQTMVLNSARTGLHKYEECNV